ncbi:MAG: O-methyltransferase [Acidobacteriota bacterium]
MDLWTKVDAYLTQTLLPSDPILDATLASNTAANLPSIDVSPLQGKFLELLVRLRNARRILEIGTLGGYSTISMARGLPADGYLLTLEFNPRHAEVARANIAHAGLAHLVEIRTGPALDSLTQLAAENPAPFDLIFLDADKRNNANYLDRVLPFTRPGTLILVDNIIRDGAILDATSTDPDVQGQRLTLEKLAANPRLSSTGLQTVGSKGYDGFAMALVLD